MGNHINGNSWCDPFKTWQKAYSFNPTDGLKGDQKKLVLGGTHVLFAFFRKIPLTFLLDLSLRSTIVMGRASRSFES
jgi:hypothetical protein